MNKKYKQTISYIRRIAMCLVVAIALNLFVPIAYADNTTIDSIGSLNKEDDGVSVGIDATQGQTTIYNDETTNPINMDKEEETLVYASQSSTFSAIIPKQIILNGNVNMENSGEYEVLINGNIAGKQTINVIPNKNFYLKQFGKNDILTSVIQNKTSWKYNETNTHGKGKIIANNMTAGSWSGNFLFDIYLDEEHFWNVSIEYPTCSNDGLKTTTCSYCGKTEKEVLPQLTHDFSQTYGKTEATCTTAGYGYACCKHCGLISEDTSIKRVPALNHDFAETFVNPTCETNGYILYECKREDCSYSYIENTENALSHDYKIISSTKETCDVAGETIYECERCQNKKTITSEANEHVFEITSEILSTCIAEGNTTYKCLICGIEKEEPVSMIEHNWDDGTTTIEPTCETYGEKTYSCLYCKQSKTEEIPMYGHMYYGDSGICEICGASIIWDYTIDTANNIIMLNTMKEEAKTTVKNVVIPSKVMIDDVYYQVQFAKSTYESISRNENDVLVPTNASGPFIGNQTIETVYFEDGTTIEDNDMTCMFLLCTSLKEVNNIPDTVEKMIMTFEYCTSLEKVPELPQNLITLVDTFKFDTGLKNVGEVIIPENVRTITGAFHSCTNMEGTIYILSRNIDTPHHATGYLPFGPAYRAFHNNKAVNVVVYKFKDKTAYDTAVANGTEKSYNASDIDLYTNTWRYVFYQGYTENKIYYTDNTYSTITTTKTNYSASTSSDTSGVSRSYWFY